MKIFDVHAHCSNDRKNDALSAFAVANDLEYNLEELLSQMRESGVYGALLLSPPMKDGLPFPNSSILALCEKSRGVLHPVLTVEPGKASVVAAIGTAKRNRDEVKGFKIRLGYVERYADDPVFAPLYDYAESTGLPVLFHTGDTATPGGSLRHAHPLTLDPLANRREELKMVICHFGNPWTEDTAELIYKHPNVYADISGMFVTGGYPSTNAPEGAKYSAEYLKDLRAKLEQAIYFAGGAQKIMFGTDYPVETHKSAVDFVKGLKIDGSDVHRILSDNAEVLFGL